MYKLHLCGDPRQYNISNLTFAKEVGIAASTLLDRICCCLNEGQDTVSISQVYLAEAIWCSPRHISRIVKKLVDKDLISYECIALGKKASDPKATYTINRERINSLCPEFLKNLSNTFTRNKMRAHEDKRDREWEKSQKI